MGVSCVVGCGLLGGCITTPSLVCNTSNLSALVGSSLASSPGSLTAL